MPFNLAGRLGAALCVCLASGSVPAGAQDAPQAGEGQAPAEEIASEAWQFDLAFGAALTSDYMFRGITQTDHEPALQPYIEPSYGIFYGGVWASNVDYLAPEPDAEVDLYFGVRPEIGLLSTDFGFLHYLYPDASDGN
jgi:uncharacterized protein (TIGR02001 family)